MCTKSLPHFVKTVKDFTVKLITDSHLFHNAPQAQAKEKSHEEARSTRR
jgi:hypothetical protein